MFSAKAEQAVWGSVSGEGVWYQRAGKWRGGAWRDFKFKEISIRGDFLFDFHKKPSKM